MQRATTLPPNKLCLRLLRLRFEKDNSLLPDNNGLAIMVLDAQTIGIVPDDFANQEVACGDFDFNFCFFGNEALQLPHTGQ
jgi:hypothetical protein